MNPPGDLLREDRRPIPLQLADRLRSLIREEDLGPGDKLPSEPELVARFGAARGSVREALKLLEQDGTVDVRHGLGRFVAAGAGLAVDRPVTIFESATEMLQSRGFKPTTRVLSVERDASSPAEAEALDLDRGAPIVRLRRLRLHRKKLLIYSVAAFPADYLDGAEPDVADFADSLTEWLAARGHRPVSSAAQLQATGLPEEVARLAEVEGQTEWLLIAERCVDEAGRLCLYTRDHHRGDVFTFTVLRRPEG
ncbi:MAG: GntR family transcriptional regulator [Actinobacteria bacterium]|nr:GntR family transcriptional regulator [Actinomycetota bacterium]